MKFRQCPDTFYELAMTRGRSIAEYLGNLGFDSAVNAGLKPNQESSTRAIIAFSEWFLGYPKEITLGFDPENYWESYGYKLREWFANQRKILSDTEPSLADLGCGSGSFILEFHDNMLELLGLTGETIPQIWGVEQYDLGTESYNSAWSKIHQAERVEILSGDFTDLPFENNQLSHIISVFGALNYGPSLLGTDLGARKQIQEMKRVAKKGILTLVPLEFKSDESYNTSDLFIIHDPVNDVHATIPVLQIMEDEGLRYNISQNPFLYGDGYYPAVCEFWRE
jgi:hypothetical protein